LGPRRHRRRPAGGGRRQRRRLRPRRHRRRRGPAARRGVQLVRRLLEWIEKTAHPVLGPLVAVGELVIGIALILGLFTGIAAFLGSTLNFSFVFAGSAGINPAMLLVSGALILAWRNAGWYGLDRWVLPAVGTPWHRGERIDAQILERDSAPARSAGRSSPRPPDDD
jgi:hypothetical protein